MKAIIILMISACFSLSAFAETPITVTKRDFNKHLSGKSKRVLRKWFKNNDLIGEYGTTSDHKACDWVSPRIGERLSVGDRSDTFITNSAYGTQGAFGVRVDNGVQGIERLTSARVHVSYSNILIVEVEHNGTVVCVK